MPHSDRVQVVMSPDGTPLQPITASAQAVSQLIPQGRGEEHGAQGLALTPGSVANHVSHILPNLSPRSRVGVASKIAAEKGRSDTETVLGFLELLQDVDSTTLDDVVQHATNVLAAAFLAEKVDAFLHDESADMLVALGTSDTPLGKRQHELGLHRLHLSNGGRAGWAFRERRAFRDGHVEDDKVELAAVRRGLGVRSTIAAPLQVWSGRRGVLLASSRQPEQFTDDQLQLLQFVAYWIGLIAR